MSNRDETTRKINYSVVFCFANRKHISLSPKMVIKYYRNNFNTKNNYIGKKKTPPKELC